MASAILASRNETCWGERKVYMRKHTNNTNSNKNPLLNLNPNPTPYPNPNPTRQIHYRDNQDHHHQQQPPPPPVAISDDSPSPKRRSISLNEAKDSSRGDHVTYNLGAHTRRELKDLKKRLISELEQVRVLKNRIESTNFDARPGPVYPSTTRQPPPPPPLPRPHPLQQLNYVTDSPPKAADDKPTPKSDLGKKKKGPGSKRVNPFPDQSRKRAALEPATEKLVSSMMRRCGQILSKLMKHKHGWVFNAPVDAVAMGLHDYHQVIKNPMDLGTVKVNLDKDLYQSPLDFASDVRLTFNNALTYNPKGHDVYTMAEILYKKFEEMFNPAYKKFEDEKRRVLGNLAVVVEQERRIWHQPPPPPPPLPLPSKGPEQISIAKRLDSVNPVPKAVVEVAPPPPPREVMGGGKNVVTTPRSGKLPKPKAKDPNKRLMSLEEKAKLGMNLQDLPLEKTAQLVHIIRKRNGHLAQDGDEIELDIETIDNETLWELDRFVCNYKKMVSKIKRQGLIQNPMMGAHVNKSPVSETAEAEVAQKGKKGDVGEEDVDIGEEIPMGNFPSVEIEKDDATACASSSSSSSSSSSDSSSSDSESGSSSGSDSDADSVRTPFVESKEAH